MEENLTSLGTGSCAKRGRFWAVTDAAGQLVCLAVYRKGAQEVLRRLGLAESQAGDTVTVPTTDARTTDRRNVNTRGEKKWPTRGSL